MIKKLKLQKAVIVFILGIIALVVYQVMRMREMDSSIYALEAAGLLFMIGALLFLFPIIFGRKDKHGNVQLDPEKQLPDDVEQ